MLPPPLNEPQDPQARLPMLDALRGFALLGILLMNIEFFNRWLLDQSLRVDAADGAAGLAAWWVYVFVQGKFWLLFTVLFGIGFALMQQRLEDSGRPFVRLQVRRSLALIGFGLVHAVLLWPGDVLVVYGLCALILLAFRRLPATVLWLTGLGLYFGMALFSLVVGVVLSGLPTEAAVEMAADLSPDATQIAAVEAVYRDGGFFAITGQRLQDFAELMGYALFGMLPMALGLFLCGVWLWQTGRIRDPQAHRRFWVASLVTGSIVGAVPIAISVSIGTALDMRTQVGATVLAQSWMLLGNLPLSLAYLAAFVLAWQSGIGARLLGVFAPAGRMALTNYLGQSLICSLLFYGYGLGWFARVDRLEQVLLALSIFAVQLAISPLWLRHFRFGPAEWLWRALTYGERPAFRRRVQTG